MPQRHEKFAAGVNSCKSRRGGIPLHYSTPNDDKYNLIGSLIEKR